MLICSESEKNLKGNKNKCSVCQHIRQVKAQKLLEDTNYDKWLIRKLENLRLTTKNRISNSNLPAKKEKPCQNDFIVHSSNI